MSKKISGERLRADIDAGKTGDKVAFPDPAAAPLATDAEAGGATTDFPSERKDVEDKSRFQWGGLGVYIGMIAAVVCVILIIWWAS